jgi:hypothetical protein
VSVDGVLRLGRGLDATFLIWNPRKAVDPFADDIAPHNGLARLILLALQNVAEAFLVDVPLQ